MCLHIYMQPVDTKSPHLHSNLDRGCMRPRQHPPLLTTLDRLKSKN